MALIESAISGIAWSVVETAGKAGKYVLKQGKGAYDDVQHKQQVLEASQNYIRHYLKRHCEVKIMPGLTKAPLDLNSIYTDVKLLDDDSVRLFAGVQELEEGFRAKGVRGFGPHDAERVRGLKVANREQFLMVLGGPGIGKSTFLRKIGLEALKKDGSIQRECIPVFLELKKFREETVDIQQEIVKELDICKFPSTEALVESALEQGKLLVLFDGLDEVPVSNLNAVIERIEDFVDKHNKNSFVASCRIAAYRSSFRRFRDVTIAEFDDEQIEQFIYRWFNAQEDEELEIAQKYWELLTQKKHEATKELAQTPLLLTFLCLLYDRKQMLPSKRSTLYGRALDIILDEWSAQKRIERNPIHERLNPELEKILLAEIAYDSFIQDQLFFTKESITDKIADFLTDTVENPKYLNADTVLREIEVQQGILVERATDAYSFSHLTLQEYLSALHIVENRLEPSLVENYLPNESWREVCLLTSGLMGNRALDLLMAMEKQAKAYIEPYRKVISLVRWAGNNKVKPSDFEQRAGMLAIAVASASTSEKAINQTYAKEIKLDIYRSVDSARAFDRVTAMERAISSAISITTTVSVASAISSANTTTNACAKALEFDSTVYTPRSVVRDIDQAIARAHSSADAFNSSNEFKVDATNSTIKGSIIAKAISRLTIKHHFLNAWSMRKIALKLEKARGCIPQLEAKKEEWRNWSRELQTIWLKEIGLEPVYLTPEEATALQCYLYTTELLIRCEESAIRVSRNEWEKIKQRLLMV
ncbi:MAG: NACHT domain-containing protein [Cyanobacteria bacterium P01_D01_bin.105]